jgi:hypothetical protein
MFRAIALTLRSRLRFALLKRSYGKTISILRQSFVADAHLSVQSTALFR